MADTRGRSFKINFEHKCIKNNNTKTSASRFQAHIATLQATIMPLNEYSITGTSDELLSTNALQKYAGLLMQLLVKKVWQSPLMTQGSALVPTMFDTILLKNKFLFTLAPDHIFFFA